MSQLDAVLRAVYRKDYPALEQFSPEQINARDADGRTPLMHAILAEDAEPRMVRFLIQHGAEVNVHDEGEAWTPLHFAARDQNTAIVRALLEAGAAVDALDASTETPLVKAVFNHAPNFGVIRLLLDYGADPRKKNHTGASSIDIARLIGQGPLADFLELNARPAK